MSEDKKLWELVKEIEEKEIDYTLNIIIATLLVNYGKDGRCIPDVITGEETPKVQMLIKVCEFYHKKYIQLTEKQKELDTYKLMFAEKSEKLETAESELAALRAELAEKEREVEVALDKIKELEKEIKRRNSKTWCAYCGFEIDIDDEASTKISEHIMSCPKHPIRIYERHSEALEAENAALREQLKKMEEAKEYKDHEFCKDVECGAFDNGRCHARQCCYRTAKHFHRWLKQNGYKIIKSVCKKGE